MGSDFLASFQVYFFFFTVSLLRGGSSVVHWVTMKR